MAVFNYRMLGPTAVADQTRTVHRRTYTAIAGQVLTVPAQDGQALQANRWTLIAPSCSTANRPKTKLGDISMQRGTVLWDETLNQFIVSDGTVWRDPTTGNQV